MGVSTGHPQNIKIMKKVDILVLGSGVAGLSFAIRMAQKQPQTSIAVLSKTISSESNTSYAQGGVAAVWDDQKDSYQKHIEDTLDAGDGLCDEEIVRIVVEEGPSRVRELIDWGTRFDKEKQDEQYDLGREGGHSENRILHYKDITGREIQRALLAKAKELPNIEVLEHHFAIDLLTQHHLGRWVTRLSPNIECYGCYSLNLKTNRAERILAKATVMASGGAGQVYKSTTNPTIATGDGMAMTYRAKGRVRNMEFVQFHPTALYNPAGENPVFLVSEAVRGFGGILKDAEGQEFMQKYDPRKSLAPRDIVARAIDQEMKNSGSDCMYLDCRHLEQEAFLAHFPNIYEKCKSIGIDPFEQMIPVVPACHYFCGGIETDAWGQTSIHRLYACGECTSTGLHGANRLASNSLLEGLVFADRIAKDLDQKLGEWDWKEGIPAWEATGSQDPKELVLITQSMKELKEIMSSYVGIVRSNLRLERAFSRLRLLYEETEELYNKSRISPALCELRNLITVAYLVTRSAAIRRESRGLHFTTDYPNRQEYLDDTRL